MMLIQQEKIVAKKITSYLRSVSSKPSKYDEKKRTLLACEYNTKTVISLFSEALIRIKYCSWNMILRRST